MGSINKTRLTERHRGKSHAVGHKFSTIFDTGRIGPTGRVHISAGTSSRWIFDVKIEKLRAEVCLYVEKIKIILELCGAQLIERLRPDFCNFIIIIPDLAFRNFSLAQNQTIYISAKKIRNKVSV
jgi:hypothetical protein